MSEYIRPDYAEEARRFNNRVAIGVGAVALAVVLLVVGFGAVLPQYRVYAARLQGRAELQRAESNRQIRVVEAQASLESADLTARAEVKRAEGVAQANTIIANGLGGPEGYLRWKFLEVLEGTANAPGKTIIYIPTEAGLPILEAGKRP